MRFFSSISRCRSAQILASLLLALGSAASLWADEWADDFSWASPTDGELDRCLSQPLAGVAHRHGFDAWLRGSDRRPDPALAREALLDRDRKILRDNEITIPESALNVLIGAAMTHFHLGHIAPSSLVALDCRPPHVALSLNGAVEVDLACNTTYGFPLNGNCVVTEAEPCTQISLNLRPSVFSETEGSQALALNWELDQLSVSAPQLDRSGSSALKTLGSALDQVMATLQSPSMHSDQLQSLADELGDRLVDSAVGSTLDISQLRETIDGIKGLGPTLTAMSKKPEQLVKLVQDLLPTHGRNNRAILTLAQTLSLKLADIEKLAPELDAVIVQLEADLDALEKDLNDVSGALSNEINSAQADLATAKDLVNRVKQLQKDIDGTIGSPAISAPDTALSASWDVLTQSIKDQIQADLPHQIVVMRLGSHTVRLGSKPAQKLSIDLTVPTVVPMDPSAPAGELGLHLGFKTSSVGGLQ